MKRLVPYALAPLFLASCVIAPPPRVYNARLYTVDNQEIVVQDLKLWEKDYQIESQEFHPRWRQSLEKVNLDFGDIVSAEKLEGEQDVTRILFRDGRQDNFNEFFEDEYNLRGWSDRGPFEINASLVRGVVFLDPALAPVAGSGSRIPPIVFPPEYQDRFITFGGDIISGEVLTEEFAIKTDYGALTVATENVQEIRVDRETDTIREIVIFSNGDILSGLIDPPRIEMRSAAGELVSMNFDQLSRVLFSRPVAKEEEK
ncbi:MAG: hypothetical protein NTV79_10940 [Candidatus Aureabacteria bacterium]|nr:hypothetical protein [Candidatus Auribacterota bacterium]